MKRSGAFVILGLAATGVLAFACGGGNSEAGGGTTPSASAPATSAASTQEDRKATLTERHLGRHVPEARS